MTDEDAPDDGDDEETAAPSGERQSNHIGPGSTAGTPPGGGGEDGEPAADPLGPADGGGDAGDRDAPLSGLREDVAERRGGEDDEFEELFGEVELGDVDEDEVWEKLSASAGDPLIEGDPETDDLDRDVTVVEKSLCHGCPHFADPPDTACTHEGTTIEAEVDVDHFRVVDCPVVEERRETEASDFSAEDG